MVIFYKRDGAVATKSEFISENKKSNREIGTAMIKVNGEELIVNAYYSGINHGLDRNGKPKIYEVVVNGNPKNAKHVGYHGHHETYNSLAATETEYDRVVTVIRAGGSL